MAQETVTLQTLLTARSTFGNMLYQETNMHFYSFLHVVMTLQFMTEFDAFSYLIPPFTNHFSHL